MLSPHNAVLDERLHRGWSRDEDSFSEAGHVNINVADDTGPADPEGRAVGSLINFGLPKLACSFNQQALSHINSFSAGTQLCLSSSSAPSQETSLLPERSMYGAGCWQNLVTSPDIVHMMKGQAGRWLLKQISPKASTLGLC